MASDIASVSVVCVTLNPGTLVDATIQSVLSQTYEHIELIVIDGASKDGTPEHIRARYPQVRLQSDPDTGIYDAMNKGVSAAQGAWVLFLGAGDELADPGLLENIFGAQGPDLSKIAIILGHVDHPGYRTPFVSRFDHRLIIRNTVHHQGTFYSRDALLRTPFDASFRVLGDYDVNLRLLQEGLGSLSVDLVVTRPAGKGLSDNPRWRNYQEEIEARHRSFPLWQSLPLDFGTLARFIGKNVLRRLR